MTAEMWVTISVFVVGLFAAWVRWVTKSIYKIHEDIQVIKKAHVARKGEACPHLR